MEQLELDLRTIEQDAKDLIEAAGGLRTALIMSSRMITEKEASKVDIMIDQALKMYKTKLKARWDIEHAEDMKALGIVLPKRIVLDSSKVDEYNIKGRGTVLAISKDDYKGTVFTLGDEVIYLGARYKITGIELGSYQQGMALIVRRLS